jgi:transposase
MALTREQIRLLLHFHWLQNVHCPEAAKKIQTLYGESTSRMIAYRCYKTFEEEGMRLEDNQRSGRSREIDREAVIQTIEHKRFHLKPSLKNFGPRQDSNSLPHLYQNFLANSID